MRNLLLLVPLVVGCGSSPTTAPASPASTDGSAVVTPGGDLVVSRTASYDGQTRERLRVHIEGAAVEPAAGRRLAVLSGQVDEALDQDRIRLTGWLYGQGQLEGMVRHHVTVAPDEIVVTFTLTPGPVYRVTTINAVELTEARATPLGWVAPLREGDVFNRDALAGAISKVNLAYHDLGYAQVETTPVTDVDRDTHTLSLVIEVRRNEVFTVERVDVVGNRRVSADAVRARVDLRPGDRYSESVLLRSRDALRATGSFDRVDIAVGSGSARGKLVVSVEVSER